MTGPFRGHARRETDRCLSSVGQAQSNRPVRRVDHDESVRQVDRRHVCAGQRQKDARPRIVPANFQQVSGTVVQDRGDPANLASLGVKDPESDEVGGVELIFRQIG